jgi:IS30 family transposase
VDPEQISGWLKGGNEPRLGAVGFETIYAFIYRTAQQAYSSAGDGPSARRPRQNRRQSNTTSRRSRWRVTVTAQRQSDVVT